MHVQLKLNANTGVGALQLITDTMITCKLPLGSRTISTPMFGHTRAHVPLLSSRPKDTFTR